MHVLEAGPERIVVETQNVSAVRSLLTLFPPGALRGASFIERQETGVWLATLSPASYVNRAAALYRHFHRRRPGSGAAARPVAKEIDR